MIIKFEFNHLVTSGNDRSKQNNMLSECLVSHKVHIYINKVIFVNVIFKNEEAVNPVGVIGGAHQGRGLNGLS